MAPWSPSIQKTKGSKTATATTTRLTWPVTLGTLIIRLQHAFLSPLVILAIPPAALLGQNIAVAILVALVGLAGMWSGWKILATTASLSLLVLVVWGKSVGTLMELDSPDTALLLIEFTGVLVFMEASHVAFTFNAEYSRLTTRDDELSHLLGKRLLAWMRTQLLSQGKLALVALFLSLALLPIASFTSIPSNQLVFSATLALLAMLVLLFLISHRREPEGG